MAHTQSFASSTPVTDHQHTIQYHPHEHGMRGWTIFRGSSVVERSAVAHGADILLCMPDTRTYTDRAEYLKYLKYFARWYYAAPEK